MKLKSVRYLWTAIGGLFVLNCPHVFGQTSVPLGVMKPEGAITLSIAAVLGKPSVFAFTITNGSHHIVKTAGFHRVNNYISIITPSSDSLFIMGALIGINGVAAFPLIQIQPSESKTWEYDIGAYLKSYKIVEPGQYGVSWLWNDYQNDKLTVFSAPVQLLLREPSKG